MLFASAHVVYLLSAADPPAADSGLIWSRWRISNNSRVSQPRPLWQATHDGRVNQIGLDAGHRRVGRLMRQNGISVIRTRKHKVTTDSNHKFNIAPNLLDRNFTANELNQKWVTDISYIWMRQGWLYLAVILDLHSRRVIGWAGQSPQEA